MGAALKLLLVMCEGPAGHGSCSRQHASTAEQTVIFLHTCGNCFLIQVRRTYVPDAQMKRGVPACNRPCLPSPGSEQGRRLVSTNSELPPYFEYRSLLNGPSSYKYSEVERTVLVTMPMGPRAGSLIIGFILVRYPMALRAGRLCS